MGDRNRLDTLIADDRGTWEKICDIINDLIISIRRALSGEKAVQISEYDREAFSGLLKKAEGMERVLREALERSAANAQLRGVAESGRMLYNESATKASRKAQRGRSVEIETMENNRFERLRKFHGELPAEWFAFSGDYFYLYSNESQTEYTILLKARITPKNKPIIDLFVRRVEDGTYGNRDILDRWFRTFRRGKGRYSWNPISNGHRGKTRGINRVDGDTSRGSGTGSENDLGYSEESGGDIQPLKTEKSNTKSSRKRNEEERGRIYELEAAVAQFEKMLSVTETAVANGNINTAGTNADGGRMFSFKKRTDNWLQSLGLQLPPLDHQYGSTREVTFSNNIIPESTGKSNRENSLKTEDLQQHIEARRTEEKYKIIVFCRL